MEGGPLVACVVNARCRIHVHRRVRHFGITGPQVDAGDPVKRYGFELQLEGDASIIHTVFVDAYRNLELVFAGELEWFQVLLGEFEANHASPLTASHNAHSHSRKTVRTSSTSRTYSQRSAPVRG